MRLTPTAEQGQTYVSHSEQELADQRPRCKDAIGLWGMTLDTHTHTHFITHLLENRACAPVP